MNDWISVEDRLPEVGKEVLVMWPTERGDRLYMLDTRNKEGELFTEIAGVLPVTHWMEFPQAPMPVMRPLFPEAPEEPALLKRQAN